jgi:tetratricopeptide (TPR) repeat protein
MGCCESYSNNAGVSYSSVTQNERAMFDRILSRIPIECRQEIINLIPVKRFLTAYQYHLQALDYLQRNEYLLAVVYERVAVQNMLRLLPYHDDHFIFVDMYKLLSVCLLETGYIELSIKSRQMALNIILKYTPTDYRAINEQYFQLAFFYLCAGICKAAERCFIKTIEIARLCIELHQDYIQKVEQLLEATR